MSHFYGSLKGKGNEITKCGTKNSGISGHIRGWNIGAVVELYHDELSGKDVCRVYKTGGSNGIRGQMIAEFHEGDTTYE